MVLQLPKNLTDITQHYVDFVRCEQHDTALKAKECMQQQWSDIIRPRRKVKVKIKGKLTSAVVEKSHYIAKLFSNCMYFHATAKVGVTLPGSTETRKCQELFS